MTSAPSAASRATWRATLWVALSACCFGSIGPLTVIALDNGAQLQGVQTWRYGVSALLLMVFAMLQRSTKGDGAATPSGVRAWHHPRTLLVAGGGQALVATLALLALKYIPAATESFLFYTYPIWVTLLSALRGVEALTPSRLVALVLAVGGIVAMVGAPDAAALHPTGIALALGAALLYAAYIPVLSHLQKERSPLDVARAMATGGAVLFGTWALATGALDDGLNVRALTASILQGVLSTLAFVGFLAGLASLGAVRTAITSTIEPFWTTLLGVVLLSQPAGAGTFIGGVCIMGAVLLLQRVASEPVASEPVRSSSTHLDGEDSRPSP